MLFTAGVKLCKHNRRVTVECCISQVVLVAVSIRCVDNKLFSVGVVGGSCTNRCHVRAVASLGHCEGPNSFSTDGAA